MLARRHDDTAAGTGLDVDVRIDAALADESEPGQAFEQRRSNGRALADEHQAFGVLEPRRQRVCILHVVVPDRDLMTLEPLEAGKRAHRVEIVVENRNLHACAPPIGGAARAKLGARRNASPFPNRACDRRGRGRRAPTKAGGDRAPRAIRARHRLRKPAFAACGAGTVPNRSYLTGGY